MRLEPRVFVCIPQEELEQDQRDYDYMLRRMIILREQYPEATDGELARMTFRELYPPIRLPGKFDD